MNWKSLPPFLAVATGGLAAQVFEHNRCLFLQLHAIAEDAGGSYPDAVARRLLLRKEGAIGTAHLGHEENPPARRKRPPKRYSTVQA